MKTITHIESAGHIVAFLTEDSKRYSTVELIAAIGNGEEFNSVDVNTKTTIPVVVQDDAIVSINRKGRNNLTFLPIHIPTINKE